MNVRWGYEGAKNEAFSSLRNRQVLRRLHDPPPPFVTVPKMLLSSYLYAGTCDSANIPLTRFHINWLAGTYSHTW